MSARIKYNIVIILVIIIALIGLASFGWGINHSWTDYRLWVGITIGCMLFLFAIGFGMRLNDYVAEENRENEEKQAYCMKCRAKREMKHAKSITMSNGKPAKRGTCPVCKTKMFRIVKS